MKIDPRLNVLAKFISQTNADFDGLTADKIHARGVIMDDPSRPGWIVVSVMRHKAALGSIYRKNFPMGAYVAYRQVVAFNPTTKVLQIDSEEHTSKASLHIDPEFFGIDYADTHTFVLEPLPGSGWLCHEQSFDERARVYTDADVVEFAKRLCSGWHLERLEIEVLEHVSPDQFLERMSLIRSILERRLSEKALRAWKSRNGDEEGCDA